MSRPAAEVMHYQAIEVPAPAPRKRYPWKVCTPKPRLFATLEHAKLYAEIYQARTGRIVAIEEVRR